MPIDLDSDFGRRVTARLRDETLIWLVTVNPDGGPVPTLVWFWWDGSSFLIYSQPDKPKLRNLERSSKVALHLNSDQHGGSVAVFTGEGHVDRGAPPAHQVPEYLARYRALMQRNGWSPEEFSRLYPVPIKVVPTRLTGH